VRTGAILYGSLAELVVDALTNVALGFLEREFH